MDEFHLKELEKHCRVCGKKLARFRVKYECTKFNEDLTHTFGLMIATDEPDIHPHQFCHGCYNVLMRARKARDTGKSYKPCVSPFSWHSHVSEGDCGVCEHFQATISGGRPTKCKVGRPQSVSVKSAITHLHSVAPPSLFPNSISRQTTHSPGSAAEDDDFQCDLCSQVVDRPIHLTTCNRLVCMSCLCRALEDAKQCQCPCCKEFHIQDYATMVQPPTALLKVLGARQVTCSTCDSTIALATYQNHLSSGCREGVILRQRGLLVDDVLSKSPDSPLTEQELKLTTSLVRRKLAADPTHSGILSVKTGGQPLTFMKVTKPRLPSTKTTNKTVRARTAELSEHRNFASKGESSTQLQDEIKATTSEERELLLTELQKGGFKVDVSTSQSLGMKADLNIPWSKLRVIRRWFKTWGVSIASEQKMRKEAKQIVGDGHEAENVPFSFTLKEGGEEMRLAPYAYVTSLWDKIESVLDQNDKNGCLHWHSDIIPPNEIWLKLGGDKGGKSFKMSFQIVNTHSPNSPSNTIVFSIFEASDSVTNLKVVADRFGEEIGKLEEHTWKGRKIRVFMCGDYEFETKSFGLSGASGRHCCLWCHIESSALQSPPHIRGAVVPRTDDSLKSDLQRFQQGGSNIKHAKNFNNVIRKPFFPIPLTQVCPPGLHISLGIFFRLFTLLEDACHELDVKHALQLQSCDVGSTYTTFTAALQRQAALRDDINRTQAQVTGLEQLLTLAVVTLSPSPATDVHMQQVTEMITTRKNKIEEMELEMQGLDSTIKKTFTRSDGPFVRAIDQALASFHVQRQAYYSGTFVGNHVHSCLKPKNIDTICNSVPSVASQHCPHLIPDAQAIAETFKEAFTLFSRCHNIYQKNHVTESEQDQLSDNIKNFMSFYRIKFPHATVTPKLHMLEEHVVEWIRTWKAGFGLMGEQGAESIHSYFNGLRRTYAGIPDKVKRLKHMMAEHLLHVAPQNTTSRPPIKKRKISTSEAEE